VRLTRPYLILIYRHPVCLDHAVQVVGLNMKEGYWIVKNQWTPKWGENGYIRIKTGSDVCGISQYATYTKVSPVPADATKDP